MRLTVRPVTPELWRALEDLFGRGGASNGCWCMYWRIGPAYRKRPREENRADLTAVIEQGPPPGLLAFDGDRAVGWCQVTPRVAPRWLADDRRLARADDAPVWSISCFYVRRGYRRQGVASELITAALRAAKQADAMALAAYPVDTDAPKATTNVFMGTASMFRKAGFKTVAQRSPSRPTMRHDLTSNPRA